MSEDKAALTGVDLAAFEAGVSPQRWAAYTAKVTAEQAYARYRWNVQLCEALYPTLHCLEVALRNALHREIAAHYRSERWFEEPWLAPRQHQQVAEAKSKLRDKRKPDDPGRVVAELSFGFWCGLFNRYYEHNKYLWPSLIKPVFPRLPSALRGIRTIEAALNDTRELRNRVFHHEPVWHWHDLATKHDLARRLVHGIAPSVGALLADLDRFSEVLKARP